jgi:hypothetical protein
MESWWIASEAVLRGESVYTATHRYNYGPLWSYTIGALRYLSAATGDDTITRLHLFMTGLLTVVDLLLAYVLSRTISLKVGILFFLNPISCFVSGYHIQFDNVAIALGLASWITFTRSHSRVVSVGAGILFGLSLSLKHIFAPFLAWIPFATGVRTLRERLAYAGIALTLFASSFAPWCSDERAWSGIERNVFGYISTEGCSVTSYLASWFGLPARPIFLALTVATGILLLRARPLHRFAPHLFLIVLPALSSGMARNYLAIPLVGIFTFLFARAGVTYLVLATLAFITVNQDLGSPEVAIELLRTPLVSYPLCQLLLLATLGEVYRRAMTGLSTSGAPIDGSPRDGSPQIPSPLS